MRLELTIATRAEPKAVATARHEGLLRDSLPIYFILAAFFVITLPFSVLAIAEEDFLSRYSFLVLFYLCCFAVTHFVITLTIYLQSANLRHFNSTWSNRTIYFLIPISIFVLFDIYSALQVAAALPLFETILRGGIRFLDFQHFNRQNFGVLQLLKARSRAPFPKWLKRAEILYFFSMTLWLMQTFLNQGTFNNNSLLLGMIIPIVVFLLLVVLYGFAKAWVHSTNRVALLVPLSYFLLQSASAALAIYSTALYFFALAMHYVEYHVLMVPRCFNTPLDTASAVDRFFGRLRGNKLVFYTVLVAVAAWVTLANFTGALQLRALPVGSGSLGYAFLLALFDGLFVFHYFIESFIWKFSEPYYRQTLSPLYFGGGTAAPAGIASHNPAGTSRGSPGAL